MKPDEMEKIIDSLVAENGFEEVVAYLAHYAGTRADVASQAGDLELAQVWRMIMKCLDLAVDAMNFG